MSSEKQGTRKNITLPRHSQCARFQTEKCTKIPSTFNDPEGIACIHFEPPRTRLPSLTKQAAVSNVLTEIVPEVPDATPYGSVMQLYDEILRYIKDHIVLGSPEEYDLVTAFVLATWLVKQLAEATYLYVTAPKGHGKTRLCEVLNELCNMAVAGSYATRAAIMRITDGSDCTLILDEGECYIQPNRPSELIALLNAGQRRGQKLLVVDEVTEINEDGKRVTVRKPVARESFGFKVLVSREDIFDTLPDRAFEVVLPKGRPTNRRIDKDRGKALRGKLRYFMETEPLQAPTPFPPELLEIIDPRLEEITTVLMQATPAAKHFPLQQIALREVTARAARMQDTVEAKLLMVIKELLEDTETQETIQRLNIIPTNLVTDTYNLKHGDPKRPLTADRIGRTLSRLKLQRRMVRDAKEVVRGFSYTPEQLAKLFNDFYINVELETEKSVSLVTLVTLNKGISTRAFPNTEPQARLSNSVTSDTSVTEPAPAWPKPCATCGEPLHFPDDILTHNERHVKGAK